MLSMEYIEMLCENSFFYKVPADALKELNEEIFHIKKYPAGSKIIDQGDLAKELYLIIEGEVRITKIMPDENEVILAENQANSFFGELGLVQEARRASNISAISDTKIVIIKQKDFFYLYNNFPQIKENVLVSISAMVKNADNQIIYERTKGNMIKQMYKAINNQKEELEHLNCTLAKTNRKLKESEKKLKESNDSKDKFFSILAHDLRNPFGALFSASDLLNKYYNRIDEVKKKDYIQKIHNSSKQVLLLLENLLEWSRAQIGSLKANPENFDVEKVISGNIALLKEAASSKKIELFSKTDSETIIYADRNMIATVIRNLLTNALKFSSENDKVWIETKKYFEKELWISICDTGSGIKEDDLPKLFNIESGFSTNGTKNEKGTGLGLLLCKEFIELNKGTISVESEYGKGSKFIFTVPLANVK